MIFMYTQPWDVTFMEFAFLDGFLWDVWLTWLLQTQDALGMLWGKSLIYLHLQILPPAWKWCSSNIFWLTKNLLLASPYHQGSWYSDHIYHHMSTIGFLFLSFDVGDEVNVSDIFKSILWEFWFVNELIVFVPSTLSTLSCANWPNSFVADKFHSFLNLGCCSNHQHFSISAVKNRVVQVAIAWGNSRCNAVISQNPVAYFLLNQLPCQWDIRLQQHCPGVYM